MKPYRLIGSDAEMAQFRKYLVENEVTSLAVDIEAEFNLHVYGEKLCLIQIFDGKSYFLIDPFGIGTRELALFFEDSGTEKIFYDCSSDAKLLYKQYGIKIASVYDLKIPVNVLELEKKGLDAVLAALLGITVSKKEKFQRYNWTRRPIENDALDYALNDVEHLFRLKEELQKKIVRQNMADALAAAFLKSAIDYNKKSIPAIKKTPDYQRLNREQLLIFEDLLAIREALAKEADCPPNSILTKEQVFQIVKKKEPGVQLQANRHLSRKNLTTIMNFIKSLDSPA